MAEPLSEERIHYWEKVIEANEMARAGVINPLYETRITVDTLAELLATIHRDRERIGELEQQLAEAKGALVEMRLALESYKTVAEGEMRTCQCRNCLDDRARLMRSRVLWLLPATNAALASDAGKAHAERDRIMQIITDAAMQLALKYDAFNELVTFSDGENALRGTINDALDKYAALAGAKEEASNG